MLPGQPIAALNSLKLTGLAHDDDNCQRQSFHGPRTHFAHPTAPGQGGRGLGPHPSPVFALKDGALCAGASTRQIELLELDSSGIHVAEYLTILPPRDVFKRKLEDAIGVARQRFDGRELEDLS